MDSLSSLGRPGHAAVGASGLLSPDVVRELSPGLLALAYRKVGHRQDAEDLVQEMWCSALRSAPSFEGRSSLRTWLATILSRRIAERFRRGRPLLPFDEEDFTPLLESGIDRLDVKLAASLVTEALDTLAAQERAAITLCDLDDVERERACEQLGVTRGHLRILLHRGRRKLTHYVAASEPRGGAHLSARPGC